MWKRWRKADRASDAVAQIDQSVQELRSSERRMIYREAFLHLPEAVRITAIAMDISPLGTRIRLTRPCDLPDELAVTVLDEVKNEPARVAWRDGSDIGLEFINPDLDADTYLDSLSSLEFDN